MITVTEHGDVAEVTLERHEKRNALDVAHLTQLSTAVDECVSSGCRALVISGAGSTFSAGADLDGVYGDGFRTALYTTLRVITEAPVPVIAAVNGPAIGAGAQLAIACDLRIAAPTAQFAIPTARNGLAVDPWTIRRLAALAGGATARALLLACDTLDATTALTRGLADRIGTTEDARTLAHEIASYAPLSLRYSKRALHTLTEFATWDDRLDDEFDHCWTSDDFAESRVARTENRLPKFAGK